MATAGRKDLGNECGHLSEWVYRAKAAKYWGMNPADLAEHPRSNELIGQAWDLMFIENATANLAQKLAEFDAKKKSKPSEAANVEAILNE